MRLGRRVSLDQFIAAALEGSMPGLATSQRGYPIFARRPRGIDQESQLSQEAVNFHAPFAASVIYHRKSRGKERERERERERSRIARTKTMRWSQFG